MARSECLYDLLGVADDATEDELKRARTGTPRACTTPTSIPTRSPAGSAPSRPPTTSCAIPTAQGVRRHPRVGTRRGRGRRGRTGDATHAWGGFEEYAKGFAERYHRAHATETEWQRRERMAKAAAERAEMEREFWIQEKARARHMAVEYRRRAAARKHSRALRHEATIAGFWFSKRGWLPMDFVALFTALAFAGGSAHVWKESGAAQARGARTGGRGREGEGEESPVVAVDPAREVAAAAVKEGDARVR